MPTTQMTTIPSEAGLTRPAIAVEGLSSAPISTPATTRMTSSPSSTGVSLPTRYVSGRDGPTAKSQTSSTIVWIAMPPIRFPAASSRFPDAAAEIVIASSGRLPAIERRISPPSSSPSPSRASSASEPSHGSSRTSRSSSTPGIWHAPAAWREIMLIGLPVRPWSTSITT